jgi:ATP-dependent DNA helicase RecG
MSYSSGDDISLWSAQEEGQFFERKSAFDQSRGGKRPRKATELAWDIVETLSAMANADGGELVIGIEDDGEISGLPHPMDKLALLKNAPGNRSYLNPPLRTHCREILTPEGKLVLNFRVEWSPDVHQLADGRYLLRVNDSNQPFDPGLIAALKQTKSQGLLERSFPPSAALSDIDLELINRLFEKAHPGTSAEESLRALRLVEPRNGKFVPNLAGLLLFGKEPARWHPRCGIDFVRWEGVERRHGAELNVVKRFQLEYPLALLPQKAYAAILPYIRERQQLHDLFFTEKMEYPTFVWQEAIVNAIAHRDYSLQGSQVEIWMFDDRMEIHSPGQPPPPVTVETLNRRGGVHLSRNPLIVRTLVELGYMRELGEGIPRMFDEMEREGFYPPLFNLVGGFMLQVTLRNQPVYDQPTLNWLRQFESMQLTGHQKRLLVFARAHGGQFTSREFQKLVGVGVYEASNEIKALIRKGLVRLLRKGGKLYQVIEPGAGMQQFPQEYLALLDVIKTQGFITNQDIRRTLAVERHTALQIARSLVNGGWLIPEGEKRAARYVPPR